MGLGLLAVHMRIDLRHVDIEAGKHSCQVGCLVAFLQRSSDFFVERFQARAAAVFYVEFEAGHCTYSLNGRRREHRNKRFLDGPVLFVQGGGDGIRGKLGRPSIIRRLQTNEYDSRVRAVGEAVDREAGECDGIPRSRLFQGNVGHPANYIFSAIEGGAIRQLSETDEIPLVLCGNKSRGHTREADNGQPNQSCINHDGDQTGAKSVRDKNSVAARGAAKEAVE